MRQLAGATPTARAAGVLAALAGAALVVPVWLAAAGALALAAAAAADAWAVRTPPELERELAPVLSRGVATELRARIPAADGRRTLLRQPATAALEVLGASGTGALEARVLARRRGRHALPGLASASVGPLGLARVGHRSGPSATVAVYPDLVGAHALIGRLRRQLAGHPGRLARGPLGLGTDFESVRDYSPDDDLRQLNWRATARLGRPMSNQYRLERDRDVVCLVDAGRLMAAPIGARTMLDAALDAATVLALAADELGDRCGAVAFDAAIRRVLAPRHLAGRRVVEALFDLEASQVDSDFELAFARVGRSRRALVAVFTDLVDEAAARSLLMAVPMLARRHTVLILSAADPALERAAAGSERSGLEAAEAVVARDVLATRARATAALGRSGATVIEAPAEQLAARALDAYLDAKARARP